jgi:protein disulfide-isomerase
MAIAFHSWVVLTAMSAASLFAVDVGDSQDDVVAEKGPPAGKMEAGGAVILRYADETITLRDGKVVTIKAVPAPDSAGGSKPASASTSAALGRAKSENRKVFLFFTGSDWCGWCMRLDKEILTTAEFINYATSDLILVKLDFPRRTQLPATLASQNQKLAQRYAVRGYPTVVVLNSEGQAVQRMGYQEGGPGPYIERLRKL